MPMSDEQLVERFNRMKAPTSIVFNQTVLVVNAAEGFVRMSFDIGPQFCNPRGHVQGGIVTAMMDDAAAFACIVKSGKRIYVPTLELKATFLAPANQGLLFAEGRCIKLGKTVAFMEAELQDETGKILAKLSTTAAPRVIEGTPILIDTSDAAAA